MCVHLFVSDMLTAFVLRSFCHVCTFASVVGQADGVCVLELCHCVTLCPFVSVGGQFDRICVEELLLCVSVCFCRGIG